MSGFSFKNPLQKRTFFILANLSEKEKIVYKLIKKHKQVTSKFIIETTSFSHATVERTIKKLSEELKCIRRNGSKKTGYWEIIMEDK